MIILNAGYSVNVSVAAGESLTVTSRDRASVAAVSGLGFAAGALGTVDGTTTFGPYSVAGVINLNANSGDCSYGINPIPDGNVTAVKDANNITVAMSDGINSIRLNPTLRTVGYENEQPAGIINPVTNIGKIVCTFASGNWLATAGSPVLTQGYTGWDGAGTKTGIVSRTGQPEMLKVVPAANTAEEITLQVPETNLLNAALNGKFGIWVYVEAQPGYQVGGTIAGGIGGALCTSAGAFASKLTFGFNTNQMREGWNFLKLVIRNPASLIPASGVTEYHPFGLTIACSGTGVNSDIVNSPVAQINFSWSNMSGCTMYFDSCWTGFDSKAQVVLGCDGGPFVETIALPIFNDYGWKGYFAFPFNTADNNSSNLTLQSNLTSYSFVQATKLYAAGWDAINHTVTHPNMGSYTTESKMMYQILQSKGWLMEGGFIRGQEFYASPRSSSSRLSESVIKTAGMKLQRHSRKPNTSVTQFGIDNPHHIGGMDIGSSTSYGVSTTISGATGSIGGMQIASKIKRLVDVAVAYGDTIFPFWHGITTTGDTGTGEDATGDDLMLTQSAFTISMDHIRQLELAGSLIVPKGISGFWYGGQA